MNNFALQVDLIDCILKVTEYFSVLVGSRIGIVGNTA
jgi:hypothetical protein